MGVQNLWMLLTPVGRKVEMESLANQVLAVDASIWLTQFVKAMRDDEGNLIKNAHLIGTFHRVSKLLYYRIKPVFVFDGQTPEIKKRTTARRRKRQEQQAANLRQTAQRILINQLKLGREALKKNESKPASAVASNFVLLEDTKSKTASAEEKEEKTGEPHEHIASNTSIDSENVIEILDSTEEIKHDDAGGIVRTEQEKEHEREVYDEENDDGDLTVDDIVLDTSRLSKIDLHAVFELPPHLQKDMIQKILRDRRQEVRDKFIPLAGNPEAYSRTQISAFLATSALHRRIETAKRHKNEEQMDSSLGEGGVRAEGLARNGKRIASDSSRFFVYQKAETDGKRNKYDAIAERDSDGEEDDMSSEAILDEIENVERSELVTSISDHDFPLPTRLDGGRKRRRTAEADETRKQALTDFSVGSVKEFALRMEREQYRKRAVEDAATAWTTRNQIYEKQEPVLAIERVRQQKLKTEMSGDNGNGKYTDSQEQQGKSHELCISFKVEETGEASTKYESLFPASIFEDAVDRASTVKEDVNAKDISKDSDDDIEWETPIQTDFEHNATDRRELEQHSGKYPNVDDDEDIEWEEVNQAETQNKVSISSSDRTTASKGMVVEKINQNEEAAELDEVDDTNDLYLSLKNELEDEKAEQDLQLLKEEALNSAIATASNLTQWAAGAVRRALEAHSQQHRKISESGSAASPTVESSLPFSRLEAAVEQASDVDEVKGVSTDTISISTGPSNQTVNNTSGPVGITQSEMSQDDGQDDEMLQLAIANSLTKEDEAARAQPSRYLGYTSPPAQPLSSHEEKTEDIASIESEQRELKKLRNRQLRDVEGFNDDMVEDVMELLRLFGVPFLVCPMEAEAQCAALEQLRLVDGVITDDSDIFPFGGKKVYKNIFHNQKFVEAFFATDIEKELGFSQEEMISLALLLGSDYTDGVRGIGIVNATEIVTAYPRIDGLYDFKKWVQEFNLAEEAQRAAMEKSMRKKTDEELAKMTPRERFQYTHASVRRKWELGEEFPNVHVVQAYTNPQVDKSDARFSWSLPDLAELRTYCTKRFGWEQSKTDSVLLPLMEKIAASNSAGKVVQTRINQFFTSYDDQVRYAKIKSKRLRTAVEGRAKQNDDGGNDEVSTSTPLASSPKKRNVYKKTKVTTSTLGLRKKRK